MPTANVTDISGKPMSHRPRSIFFRFLKSEKPSRNPEPEKRSFAATSRDLYCKARATILAEPKIIDAITFPLGAAIVCVAGAYLGWLA